MATGAWKWNCWTSPTLLQRKAAAQATGRVRTDPHGELAWFYAVLHVQADEAQLADGNFKTHLARFAWLESDAVKAFEFADGTGHAGYYVANVQLNYFGAHALTGVSQLGAGTHHVSYWVL